MSVITDEALYKKQLLLLVVIAPKEEEIENHRPISSTLKNVKEKLRGTRRRGTGRRGRAHFWPRGVSFKQNKAWQQDYNQNKLVSRRLEICVFNTVFKTFCVDVLKSTFSCCLQ